MPQVHHIQTYENTHISSFTSRDIIAAIHSYNGPSLPSGSSKQPSLEHPYIYLPYINRSLYELLSVADQYHEKLQSACKMLFFPSEMFLYTSFEKWKIPAHVDGVVVLEKPSRYFTANCGLTPLDRKDIGEEVAKGKTLKEIWL